MAPRSSASSFLSFRRIRHVALGDAQRQAFDDRGFADAGLADQHRIVLGAARQHLHGAADFLVAADHRVELAFARRLGQVARVFLQRVIALFRRGAVGLAAFAHLLDGAVEVLRVDTRFRQRLRRGTAFRQGQRQQQPLGGDEGIAGLGRDILGLAEQPVHFRRQIDLAGAALDARQLVERRVDRDPNLIRVAAGRANQVGGKAFLVVD